MIITTANHLKKVRLNLVGQIFERLRVISFDSIRNGRSYWRCLCNCGTITIVQGSLLKNGNTKSCGCYQKELVSSRCKLPEGEACFNVIYGKYKRNAYKRKLEFCLTKEQFMKLIFENCYFCNAPPNTQRYYKPDEKTFKCNGIDRLNTKIGYILTNCVPCCTICNRMKNKSAVEDFINHIKIIYNNVKKTDNR